jgi:hypothetical protein
MKISILNSMKKQQKPQSDKKEKKRTIEGNKAIDSHNE